MISWRWRTSTVAARFRKCSATDARLSASIELLGASCSLAFSDPHGRSGGLNRLCIRNTFSDPHGRSGGLNRLVIRENT
eukprot:6206578-Pleurochrysis_carterae.AAC.4